MSIGAEAHEKTARKLFRLRLRAEKVAIVDEPEDARRSAEWDVRCGPKNYLGLAGAQATSSALAFAALCVAARVLGPAGYGGIAALIAASQLVGQLAVQWSAVSVVRYGCEEFVQTGRVAAAFWTRTSILVPNLLIVVAASRWWLPLISAWLHLPPAGHRLVVAHLLTTVIWIHVQQTLQAAKLPRVQGGLLALERCLALLVLAALAVNGRANVFSVMWAYIIAPAMVSVVGLWRLRSLLRPIRFLDRAFLARMLRYSYPLIPCSLVGYLSTNYLDALFISHFLSAAELGRYCVAYQLAGTSMQLPLLAGSLLLPLFVTLQANNQGIRVTLFMREMLPALTLVWSVGCASMAGLGALTLPALFGPHFNAVGATLWPLMAASAIAGPSLMGYAPVNSADAATTAAAAAGTAAACTNIALDALLIPRYGLLGCAWGTALAYGVGTATAAACVYRRSPSHRSWALQGTLPAVIGAACATWRLGAPTSLALSVLSGVIIAALHRRAIAAAVHALASLDTLKPFLRVVKAQRAFRC